MSHAIKTQDLLKVLKAAIPDTAVATFETITLDDDPETVVDIAVAHVVHPGTPNEFRLSIANFDMPHRHQYTQVTEVLTVGGLTTARSWLDDQWIDFTEELRHAVRWLMHTIAE